MNIPCISASCPRCNLPYSETIDQSIFTNEELIAIEWAKNYFNNMAEFMLPPTEANIARQQADTLQKLLERFTNNTN